MCTYREFGPSALLFLLSCEQGILKPYVPLNILKNEGAVVVVDAGLGCGLYAGPQCMQMAIDKGTYRYRTSSLYVQ